MKRLLQRSNRRISLGGAATLLIFTTLLGQVLGFLRTMLVNGSFERFGPQSTDAYFAAFKIPDFFFLTLAAGALGVAFVPILAEHLARSDRRGVWELSNSLLNLLVIIMLGVGVVILVAAEPLMHVVAPDLTPDQLHNAVTIMRLVSLNPLFFTISGVLTAVQQTFGRFFFFAIGPLVYNLSIIASIFIFRNNIGLIGLGVGAFVGGLLQLLTSTLGLFGLDFRYRFRLDWRNHDFRRIMRQLPPRSLDQGVDSINSIVETNRARALGEGNVSSYENAFTLHTAPILLIGSAISTAAFPRLAERLARNHTDLFRQDFSKILRVLIWVGAPVAIVSYFSRGYLARLIYKQGAPDIALILGFLSAAIFFRILYTLLSRYFYANKDTFTPLIISILAIGLNIFLAFTLAKPTSYGIAGLGIAQSVVAAVEVVLLFGIMIWRDRKILDREFWSGIIRILSVCGFTVMAAFTAVSFLPLRLSDRGFFTLGSKFGFIAGITLLTHLLVSALFSLREAEVIFEKIKNLILKPIRIQ